MDTVKNVQDLANIIVDPVHIVQFGSNYEIEEVVDEQPRRPEQSKLSGQESNLPLEERSGQSYTNFTTTLSILLFTTLRNRYGHKFRYPDC